MKEKKNILTNGLFQSIVSAIICILLGLLVGYLVLLAINPAGAGKAIQAIIRNYLNYPTKMAQMKYLGNTLVKTAPLLMCALSIKPACTAHSPLSGRGFLACFLRSPWEHSGDLLSAC